jgi:hypothetical protein
MVAAEVTKTLHYPCANPARAIPARNSYSRSGLAVEPCRRSVFPPDRLPYRDMGRAAAARDAPAARDRSL